MQIPKEYLEEKNYDGSRLIEITDETILELQEETTKLQLEANPFLEKMDALTPQLDEVYGKIAELERQKKVLQEEVRPIREKYDAELEVVEEINQRADLIKNKMQPIIADLIKDSLGEFEKAKHTVKKDGKLYVEVFDEIEEKVKAIREANLKKK